MSSDQDRAATIDHQEVHVNLSKPTESKPAISQGQIVTSQPNAAYKSGETGIVFQPPPDPKDKPKDYVVTSCGVLLLCNFIFGFLGYHFGVKANHAWQLGDIHTSRMHAKKALFFVITGIIVGILTYVLSITLYLTLNESKFI